MDHSALVCVDSGTSSLSAISVEAVRTELESEINDLTEQLAAARRLVKDTERREAATAAGYEAQLADLHRKVVVSETPHALSTDAQATPIVRRLREIFDLCSSNNIGVLNKLALAVACQRISDVAAFFHLYEKVQPGDGSRREAFEWFFQQLDDIAAQNGGNLALTWEAFQIFYARRLMELQALGELSREEEELLRHPNWYGVSRGIREDKAYLQQLKSSRAAATPARTAGATKIQRKFRDWRRGNRNRAKAEVVGARVPGGSAKQRQLQPRSRVASSLTRSSRNRKAVSNASLSTPQETKAAEEARAKAEENARLEAERKIRKDASSREHARLQQHIEQVLSPRAQAFLKRIMDKGEDCKYFKELTNQWLNAVFSFDEGAKHFFLLTGELLDVQEVAFPVKNVTSFKTESADFPKNILNMLDPSDSDRVVIVTYEQSGQRTRCCLLMESATMRIDFVRCMQSIVSARAVSKSQARLHVFDVLREPKVGVRVMRGPDWKWGDQDGGEGNLGTTVDGAGDGWINVRWDHGKMKSHRIGSDGNYDLNYYKSEETRLAHDVGHKELRGGEERVEIYSNNEKKWCPGVLTEMLDGGHKVRVVYDVNGRKATKLIHKDHKHLRRFVSGTSNANSASSASRQVDETALVVQEAAQARDEVLGVIAELTKHYPEIGAKATDADVMRKIDEIIEDRLAQQQARFEEQLLSQERTLQNRFESMLKPLENGLLQSPATQALVRDFDVVLEKTADAKSLGLRLNNQTLKINLVRDGLVRLYNEKVDADSQVRKGDYIIEVNGCSEDIEKMLGLLRSNSERFNLRIRRYLPINPQKQSADTSKSLVKQELANAVSTQSLSQEREPSAALRELASAMFACHANADVAFEAFDTEGSGRVSMPVFGVGLQALFPVRFQGNVDSVFRELDELGTGVLMRRQFRVLDRVFADMMKEDDGFIYIDEEGKDHNVGLDDARHRMLASPISSRFLQVSRTLSDGCALPKSDAVAPIGETNDLHSSEQVEATSRSSEPRQSRITKCVECIREKYPEFKICLLGGSLYGDDVGYLPPYIEALARALECSKLNVRVFAGGRPGIQQLFVESSLMTKMPVVSLLPSSAKSQLPSPALVEVAGDTEEEKVDIFASVGDLYIAIAGGPGVTNEAAKAAARGAMVLPLSFTGGASASLPLSHHDLANGDELKILSDRRSPPEIVANVLVSIIQAVSSRTPGPQIGVNLSDEASSTEVGACVRMVPPLASLPEPRASTSTAPPPPPPQIRMLPENAPVEPPSPASGVSTERSSFMGTSGQPFQNDLAQEEARRCVHTLTDPYLEFEASSEQKAVTEHYVSSNSDMCNNAAFDAVQTCVSNESDDICKVKDDKSVVAECQEDEDRKRTLTGWSSLSQDVQIDNVNNAKHQELVEEVDEGSETELVEEVDEGSETEQADIVLTSNQEGDHLFLDMKVDDEESYIEEFEDDFESECEDDATTSDRDTDVDRKLLRRMSSGSLATSMTSMASADRGRSMAAETRSTLSMRESKKPVVLEKWARDSKSYHTEDDRDGCEVESGPPDSVVTSLASSITEDFAGGVPHGASAATEPRSYEEKSDLSHAQSIGADSKHESSHVLRPAALESTSERFSRGLERIAEECSRPNSASHGNENSLLFKEDHCAVDDIGEMSKSEESLQLPQFLSPMHGLRSPTHAHNIVTENLCLATAVSGAIGTTNQESLTSAEQSHVGDFVDTLAHAADAFDKRLGPEPPKEVQRETISNWTPTLPRRNLGKDLAPVSQSTSAIDIAASEETQLGKEQPSVHTPAARSLNVPSATPQKLAEEHLACKDRRGALRHQPEVEPRREQHEESAIVSTRKLASSIFAAHPNAEIAFDAFDVEGRGKVTITEFRAGCKALFPVRFDGNADEVFRKLDEAGNGFLRRKQFKALATVFENMLKEDDGFIYIDDEDDSHKNFDVRKRLSLNGQRHSTEVEKVGHGGSNERDSVTKERSLSRGAGAVSLPKLSTRASRHTLEGEKRSPFAPAEKFRPLRGKVFLSGTDGFAGMAKLSAVNGVGSLDHRSSSSLQMSGSLQTTSSCPQLQVKKSATR